MVFCAHVWFLLPAVSRVAIDGDPPLRIYPIHKKIREVVGSIYLAQWTAVELVRAGT